MIIRLEKWFGVNQKHPDFRFRVFLLSALIVISSVFAFFSYYNLVIEFFAPMLIVNSIGFFFCFIAGYYLLVKQLPKVSAMIIQLIVSIDSFVLIVIDGNEEFALAFSFLTPVIGIFLLGYRYGMLLSLINFIAIFSFCFTQMDYWKPAPFLAIDLIHFSFIYFLILIVSFFYDTSRRKAYEMMEEANTRLQEQATTDVLTKLHNRRYLEDQLLNSEKNQYIAMIDVDDFKKVNDQYGHHEGDNVLIELARIFKNSIGSNDIIGRWGGEEFVIIFADPDLEAIKENLNRLNQNVANYHFNIDCQVTVSIGLSAHDANHHRDSLRKADQALYEAKADGKNKYCIVS